jgi:uncharacterized protein
MLTQAERDLLWTINSPSLIHTGRKDGKLEQPMPLEREFNSSVLHARLASTPHHRVGRYFEELVHFYLEVIQGFELVERGLQIQENGRTVGEIDFLYRDASGSLCHCETAVKFYLHLPEAFECGSHWVGPNAADNFDRKMQRLFEHQLPLSRGRFPDVVRREAFVKGRIFYHPLLDKPTELPERLSADHLKGTWIRESELHLLKHSNAATKFRIVTKPHWLAPEFTTAADSALLTVNDVMKSLQQHFNERRTPQLVSSLIEDNDGWHENNRTFVVSDQWPRDAG